MSKEFEAKAHVDKERVQEIIALLNSEYGNGRKIVKSDCYYKDKDGFEFRLRQIDDTLIYTQKKNNTDANGFECNVEQERVISKIEAEKIASNGVLFFKKIKNGYVWQTKFSGNKSNIELFDVSSLGYFLEIEVIFDENISNINSLINDAKNWIMLIFKKFRLENSIEKRKYMEMIGYER